MENRGKGIYIAVLNQGHIRTENHFILSHISKNSDYNVFFSAPADKPIQHNRNKIVQDFLKKKEYDYLMMLDSDVVPPANIIRLADYDEDVIGALCFAFKKTDAGMNAIMPLILEKFKREDGLWRYRVKDDLDGSEGLVEADAVGTGCIMVHRRVLEDERMKRPFKNYYDENGLRIEGLDLSFCRRVKECGYKVFAHLDFPCSHWTDMDLKDLYESMTNGIKMANLKSESKNE